MNNKNNSPPNSIIEKTVHNLQKNGFEVLVVDTKKEALEKVTEIIPIKNQVLTMSSVTLEQAHIYKEINETGKYDSLHQKIVKLGIVGKEFERKKLISTPRIAVGSINAITQNGELFFASNSGSQIPAYSYASEKVVLISGINKIIPSVQSAFDRIYKYVLPLEKKRVKLNGSSSQTNVNKIFIQNREPISGRTTIILVRQALGY
jgi:L-lactate utilization protein LutB